MEFELRENQQLGDYTTLKVGGVADYFAVVRSEEELKAALLFAKKQTVTPPFILGGGSNILCSDAGYRGVVIKIELKGIEYDKQSGDTMLVTAAAGERWDDFVQATIQKGLVGLENLSGIPGTVGASPVQNINAYGVSVSSIIDHITVCDMKTQKIRQLSNDECCFGYRDSLFKQSPGEDLIVLSVTFRLQTVSIPTLSYRSSSQSIETYLKGKGIDSPSALDIREAVLHVRSHIGMLEGQFRSAGSFFKNTIISKEKFTEISGIVEQKFSEQNKKFSPWHWSLPDGREKIATAFLLECSPYNKHTYGKKRINHVGFSPRHSLSIVTEERATAADVEYFSQLVSEAVKEIFSVQLEREVLSV